MIVKEARKKHVKEISDLLKDLETERITLSEEEYIAPLLKRKSLYVLVDGKKVIGMIGLDIKEMSCEIVYLVSHKKSGGTTLIKFAEKLCKKRKIPKLWCWSLTGYNASGFYSKMGFNEQYFMKKQWFDENCYYFGKLIT